MKALEEAVREHGTKYAREIKFAIDSAHHSVRHSYMALASLISEYLPRIINALEDARVNRELFGSLSGTKQMFDADTKKILKNGVEQLDRSGDWGLITWDTYPLNAQVVCGLFMMSSGYEYDSYFHEDVVTALHDEKLAALVAENTAADSVSAVYGLAFPILARLRELGFCRAEHEPEDEEPPPPVPDESDEDGDEGEAGEDSKETDDDGGSGGDSEDESSSDSGSDSSSEADSPGDPGGDGGGEDSGSSSVPEGDPDGSSESSSGGDSERGEEPADGDEDSGSSPDSGSGDDTRETSEGDPGRTDSSSGEDDRGMDRRGDDVGDDAEGSEADGSETEGSSGSSDGDEELDRERRSEDSTGRDDPGGESDLAEDSGDPSEGGSDSHGKTASEPSSGPDSSTEDPGVGDDSDLSSPGDGDSDLGGSERLDSADGEDLSTGTSESADRPDGDRDRDDEEERLDTGPFTKGTRLVVDEDEEKAEAPRPEMGTPEEVEIALLKLGDHEPPDEIFGHARHDDDEIELMKIAIVQGMYFETPSTEIIGVQHYNFPEVLFGTTPDEVPDIKEQTGRGWYYGSHISPRMYGMLGIEPEKDDSFDPPLAILTEATLKARIAFADNMRGRYTGGHKSGRVNARHLGKRVPVDDERIMKRKIKASKKSYFVLVGIDISGSTTGENIYLAKKVAMAECEMLSDLGVKFAVYAHSGATHGIHPASDTGMTGDHLHIYNVKLPDEPWTDRTRHKLKALGADAQNLDGHTMEYYRRILDAQRETVKVLHYYTDGAMPAENHDEELEILTREIQTCKRKGYIPLGVGIRTDAPRQHGLETVEVNEVADIMKVIDHLERELTRH